MAYRITTPLVGAQPIADTSTTKQHELGQIVQAVDPSYGMGEFIYLLGVGSTVVGSAVNWSLATHQTALAVVGNDISRPIGFAMSANGAAAYGWYQISGFAVAKKNAAVSLGVGEGIGIVSTGLVGAQVSTAGVNGAVVAALASATTSATTVLLHVMRPTMGTLED